MPIRAENRSRYPENWPEISLRIRRDRAKWVCETPGCGAKDGHPHPITGSIVVLTVGHLNHCPEDSEDENLRAMCQRCHLAWDRPHHQLRRRANAGQPDLLEGTPANQPAISEEDPHMKRLAALTALALGAMGLTPAEAQSPNPNRLRICAGSEAGNYTFAAREIGGRAASAFSAGVDVVTTAGSLENLRRLSAGECDVAFAQSDVTALYQAENPAALNTIEPFHKVYEEFVHLLCPVSSGWSRVNDMGRAARDGRGARLVVGPDGSGTAETWRAMRQADVKLYEKVERLPLSVGRASLGTVRDSSNTCVLWISGLNSADMQAANLMSANNPRRAATMRLMDFDDRDIRALRSSSGQPMYQVRTIDRVAPRGDNPGLYGNLIESGTFSAGSVNVLTVSAQLLVRSDYRAAIGGRADRLMQAIDDAGPTIWRRVNPQ